MLEAQALDLYRCGHTTQLLLYTCMLEARSALVERLVCRLTHGVQAAIKLLLASICLVLLLMTYLGYLLDCVGRAAPTTHNNLGLDVY